MSRRFKNKYHPVAGSLDSNVEAFSDSEAAYKQYRGLGYYQMSGSLPDKKTLEANYTDDEDTQGGEAYFHEFGDANNYNSRLVKSGRQRKKIAARSKGGEFQTKRKKRRVYFCCLSSEIDIQKLLDYLNNATDILFDWKFEFHNDVLHMYKASLEETTLPTKPIAINRNDATRDEMELASTPILHNVSGGSKVLNPLIKSLSGEGMSIEDYLKTKMKSNSNSDKNATQNNLQPQALIRQDSYNNELLPPKLAGFGSKEVFIFDFGAAVFWGFSRGEEAGLLQTIRMFVTKGVVAKDEFGYGEDDMAFVTSPDEKEISVANDVITLPDDTLPKQRLAVSFAIAQSSVLAIFEARIERKVEEYKYIPETLAAQGKIHLSERQLGMMIGEVFVIRHDVNLHTEILDTPDFFWKEKVFESDYKMACGYLEMAGRTEILNKRLDMLRELLDVLQQQMENAHGIKLEWIVIYLIVAEVVLQGLAIVVSAFK